LADNKEERTQAEAQFKKTQKQQEGAAAVAAYVKARWPGCVVRQPSGTGSLICGQRFVRGWLICHKSDIVFEPNDVAAHKASSTPGNHTDDLAPAHFSRTSPPTVHR
jgi:hypothetical protein